MQKAGFLMTRLNWVADNLDLKSTVSLLLCDADTFCLLLAHADTIVSSGGRTGLMVRASDFGSGDPGSILGLVDVFVSLSKRHLPPKSTGNTQE